MKNKLNKREKIKREFDSILPTLKATFMFLSSHSCPHLAQLSSGMCSFQMALVSCNLNPN